MSEDLDISAFGAVTAAGGNSRLARSARAKLQWRDRYGRWIEMGRGVKFKLRFPDGSPRSVIGKFVGAKDAENGQVYVSKDPNGLPDGYYTVNSKNAQEMVADLSPEDLKSRGIAVGVDAGGNKVGERMSEDIPNASDVERADAPAGWKKLPETFGGKSVIETDDQEFRIHFGGKDNRWIVEDKRGGGGSGTAYNNPGDAFKQVQNSDEGRVDLSDDNEEKLAQLGRDELIDSIKLNERTINNERASIDAKQRAMNQNEQIKKDLDAKGFDAYDPEGKDSDEELAKRKAEPIEGAQDPTDAVTNTPGAIDTNTFGVEPEGFLVPTGKKTNDISAEGLAAHIEAEMEHYTEGGKRLVVDTDLGEAEGYNSADTFDNAKAQAGGVGVDHVLDLAAGKVEPVEAPKNVDSSGTGDGTDGEVRDPNAVEPQGSDAGATPTDDSGVGGEAEPADKPAAGGDSTGDSNSGDSAADSGDKPSSTDDGDAPSDPNRRAAGVFRKPDEVASERDQLTKERDNNQRALQNTGNRNVMDRLISRLDEINTRLDELDREDSDRDASEKASEAPQNADTAPGSPEELVARRAQLQAALENTGDTKDMIALNEQIDALDNRIAAAQHVQDRVAQDGGLSAATDLLTEPTDGYMVAVQGHNREIPEAEFFDGDNGARALIAWMDENIEALAQPGAHVGLWHDKENGEVVLDVSQRVESLEEATRLGQERNQQAVWDVANGEEIDTGGTGDRAEAPDSGTGELARDDRRAEDRVGQEGPGDSSSGEVDLQRIEDAERDIDAANGQEKMAAGRPDDLTRGEVDALDTERRGWAEVMADDEGRDDKYAGLTPDQIAGDAPYVNGQPDFYQESPEAKAGFAKVMDYLEEPLNEGGMFDRLTPEELEAFKEATAKDRAWVNARNNWNADERPAWQGPNGETAQEAVDNALSAPTGREQRQNLENLYAGMDRYEREVFDRDREAFKLANPDHRQPAALPDEDKVAENAANRQAIQDDLETRRMAKEENPNFQALQNSSRGTSVSVTSDGPGGRRTDTYVKGNDGRWINQSTQRSTTSDALFRDVEDKNAEFDFSTPEGGDGAGEISRQEWDRRVARIAELEDAINADNEALDDLDDDDPQREEAMDRLVDNVSELNDLLVSTPSAEEMDSRDGTQIADQPLPTELQDLETIFSDDGFVPDLEALSDDELENILDAINRLNARGKGDPMTQDVEEQIRNFLPDNDERVARHQADRERILEEDPLQRLDNEIADNQAALPSEEEELAADRALMEAQVGDLTDDYLRERVRYLEGREEDGTSNADEENELSVLREESVKRQNARNAVNEAAEGLFDDADMEDLANWSQDPEAAQELEAYEHDLHVGDIIKDANGNLFEVIATDADGAKARERRGDRVVDVDEQDFDRVFNAEKALSEKVFKKDAKRKRAERIVNEQKFSEENPSKAMDGLIRSIAEAEVQGKDVDEDTLGALQEVIADPGSSREELSDVRAYVSDLPNLAGTETKERIVVRPQPLDESLEALFRDQDEPSNDPQFDILWQGVVDAFPDAIVSPEGDLIIDRIEDYRTPAKRNNKINKDYELRIRRTDNNTAFVYVLERDTLTGERKALRLSPVTHSWDTFAGRLQRAQTAFRNPKLHITVSRSEATEHLGTNRDVGENPLREFLEQGVRPSGPDEIFNQIANDVIDRLLQGEKFGKMIDGLRKMEDVDTDAVNRVAQAFIAQMMAPNAANFKPRDVHTSYDGTKVEAGMRFDWTDHRQFLDWYKPTMRKNPDYLKVYRGTVIALKDEHSDGKGRRYGDDLVIQFDKGQGKNTNQGSLVAQAIKIVGPDAPLSEPFEAKREELDTPEKIAAAFGLPAANGKTSTDIVDSKPRPKANRKSPVATRKINPQTNTVAGYEGVFVPFDHLQAAEKLEDAEKTNKSGARLEPGDMISIMTDGVEEIHTVLSVEGTTITTGVANNGVLSVHRHTASIADYLVATPNWDIVETPDHIIEDRLVTVGGRRGRIVSIGNGFAMVQTKADELPERHNFDEIEVIDEDPEITALRKKILDSMNNIELSARNTQFILNRIINNSDSLASLDNIALHLSELGIEPREPAEYNASMSGALGVPAETLDRLVEKLDTPPALVADTVPVSTPSALPRDFEKAMEELSDSNKYTYKGLQDFYPKGTRLTLEDSSGNEAVVTMLADMDSWGHGTFRVESIKDGDKFYRDQVVGGVYQRSIGRMMTNSWEATDEHTINSMTVENIPVSEKSKLLVSYLREDFTNMIREFKSGWRVNFVPSGGVMHDVAQGVTTNAGGDRIFMKRGNARSGKEDGHREYLSLVVARAIGFDNVRGSYDSETETFLMNVVDGELAAEDPVKAYRSREDLYSSANGWMLGMLDMLIQNHDRHNGNYMFGRDGSIVPIDHGHAAFTMGDMPGDFARDFMKSLSDGSAPITTAQLLRMRNEIAATMPFFEAMGRLAWYDAVMTNMNTIVETRRNSEGSS